MEKIKILVPTDFSECATNALNFALGLADRLNAELIILHSIIYNDRAFVNSKSKEIENTKLFNRAKENLDNTLQYARNKNSTISIKEVLDGGTPESSLEIILHDEQIDYVVMGTEGASGLKAAVFGSFTSNVLSISPCPVFTIPNASQFTKIENIVCATEMDVSENKALIESFDFAKKFNATITYFNVDADKNEQEILLNQFQKRVSYITDYPSIRYSLVESNDIIKAIDTYVRENNPDLIITLGKERDFFDQLFGKKVTKQLCMHTTIPLLSYPSYHSIKESEIQELLNSYQNKKNSL
jgi:nucleotide-binding universal stress UspA family protein